MKKKTQKKVDVPDWMDVNTEDTDALVRAALSCRRWFLFSKDITLALPLDGCVVFQYLLSIEEQRAERDKVRDGWFCIGVREMQRELNIPADVQQRILNHLEKIGVLHRTRRGVPPRRYIRLDMKMLLSLMQASKERLKEKALQHALET